MGQRHGVFFFLCLLFLSAVAEAAIDLRTYVNKAVENSPPVDSARRIHENAQAALKNASRFYWPTLTMSSTLGKRGGEPPYLYQPDMSDLSVGLNMTLYDGGDSFYLWNQAERKVEETRLELSRAQDQTTLEALKRFLVYSRVRLFNEITEESYRILERQTGVVSSQYRQGLRTQKDYLRLESQVHRGQIELSQSRSQIEQARSALAELWPALGTEEVTLEKPPAGLVNEQIRIISPDNHRDRRIIQLQQEGREDSYKIQRYHFWPELGLKANAGYQASDFTTPDPNATSREARNWNVLLTATWTIFDWGIEQRKNGILLNQNRMADNDDEQTLRKLKKDLLDLSSRANQLKQSLKLSSELLKMETSSYRVLESDYRQGKSSYLDLITGLKDLFSARQQFLDDQFQWLNLKYEALYHEGRLYEQFRRE